MKWKKKNIVDFMLICIALFKIHVVSKQLCRKCMFQMLQSRSQRWL